MILVGRGGCGVGRMWDFRSWSWGPGVQNHLLMFQNLGNFVHPTLPVSFGKDNK